LGQKKKEKERRTMTPIPLSVSLPPAKMPSPFRQFCSMMWEEHKDEIFSWTGKLVEYDSDYYFRKHRWLLKKMFKEQQNG
jgi:hypothetical protein